MSAGIAQREITGAYELEHAPGVPLDDVVEVSNYVAALEQGLRLLSRRPSASTASSGDCRRTETS